MDPTDCLQGLKLKWQWGGIRRVPKNTYPHCYPISDKSSQTAIAVLPVLCYSSHWRIKCPQVIAKSHFKLRTFDQSYSITISSWCKFYFVMIDPQLNFNFSKIHAVQSLFFSVCIYKWWFHVPIFCNDTSYVVVTILNFGLSMYLCIYTHSNFYFL